MSTTSYTATARQDDLLRFIRAHMASNGVCPSFQEMAEGLGLASKSGVHRLVDGLEERGHLRRIRNRSRCIELIAQPAKNRLGDIATSSLIAELESRGFKVVRG